MIQRRPTVPDHVVVPTVPKLKDKICPQLNLDAFSDLIIFFYLVILSSILRPRPIRYSFSSENKRTEEHTQSVGPLHLQIWCYMLAKHMISNIEKVAKCNCMWMNYFVCLCYIFYSSLELLRGQVHQHKVLLINLDKLCVSWRFYVGYYLGNYEGSRAA